MIFSKEIKLDKEVEISINHSLNNTDYIVSLYDRKGNNITNLVSLAIQKNKLIIDTKKINKFHKVIEKPVSAKIIIRSQK